MWQDSRLSSPSSASARRARRRAESWVGRYTLGGGDELALTLSGKQALVALGAGHADLQAVPLSTAGGRIRFQLPGRPAAVVFDGAIANGKLAGTVRQGSLARHVLGAPGQRRRPRRARALPRRQHARGRRRRPLRPGPARRSRLGQGARALSRRAPVRDRLRVRDRAHRRRERPPSGRRLPGSRAAPPRACASGSSRCASAAAPSPSPGRSRSRPARESTRPLPSCTAPARQSGPTSRISRRCCCDTASPCSSTTSGATASPGGIYPGASPTAGAIDTLARDAAAAARFLAAQPEIDRTRVGLTGQSQAGWIAPLAAAREPAVRFLVLFSGPAVTADENDLYQDLAGEGERPPDAALGGGDRRGGAQARAERLRSDPLDPEAEDPRSLALRRQGHLHPAAPLGAPARADRRRAGRDFTVVDFPNANHALVETTTGLTSEMLRSDTFAPGLFSRVGAWLREHKLT